MTDLIIFTADLASKGFPLRQPWQWCVGSGHATLALRADWQAQLLRAKQDLGFRHVRFHGILDDDMGTLICQDDQPLYSFLNADRIFDYLLSIGIKPVVELSFMPLMLSSGGDLVFHYRGNITPPRDYAKWGELVRRLAQHLIDRYGIAEVSQWPFECWNEPNLKAFWTGTRAGYFKLFKTTHDALKSVDTSLRIGGPVTADNEWLPEFSAFCAKAKLKPDFISTHLYPTDAFGKIDTDTRSQLRDSPPGIMRTRAKEARKVAGKKPLYYTEWSISSNPRDQFHDSSFAAAFAVRIVMSVDDVVDGYSYWTFSDIFEENYLPSMPYHGGFGMMNLYGVPKPIYRAMQMVRALGDEHVKVTGQHDNVAVWIGRRDGDNQRNDIVLINQALPEHPVGNEAVRLRLMHPAAMVAQTIMRSRVDEDHANPERAWHEMGSPEYPSNTQVNALHAASELTPQPVPFVASDGMIEIDLMLTSQSVNHLQIDWQRPA